MAVLVDIDITDEQFLEVCLKLKKSLWLPAPFNNLMTDNIFIGALFKISRGDFVSKIIANDLLKEMYANIDEDDDEEPNSIINLFIKHLIDYNALYYESLTTKYQDLTDINGDPLNLQHLEEYNCLEEILVYLFFIGDNCEMIDAAAYNDLQNSYLSRFDNIEHNNLFKNLENKLYESGWFAKLSDLQDEIDDANGEDNSMLKGVIN